MGSDRKQMLGAEELERRMAPGRLAYDVPAQPGPGDDSGSLETKTILKEEKKGGRGGQLPPRCGTTF